MIQDYVNKLIENLPPRMDNDKPIIIDLVLDGGVFNGSYLVGALYFLKEMEKRKYIKISRISGSSIGSIAAFLYFIDGLDIIPKIYEVVHDDLRKTHCLQSIKNIKSYIKDQIQIPDDITICRKTKKRLFITYTNAKKLKKVTKSSYKNFDDIINTIIRSCFIPYLIDGNILYENKYFDGMNPYIFKRCEGRRILYLDLFGYDKIGYIFNVKNEKTNFHRILSGLLDIHGFFIKNYNTHMCSYVDNWTIGNNCHYLTKHFFERICLFLVYITLFIKKYVSDYFQFTDTLIYKIVTKIARDIFIIILEKYCL